MYDLSKSSHFDILCLAYNYEKFGLNLYSKFDQNDVFKSICDIRSKGIELISQLATNYNYKLKRKKISLNLDFPDQIDQAIYFEEQINLFYQNATDFVDLETRDLFFRLWATSNNEYLKTLNLIKNPSNLQNMSSDFQDFIKFAKNLQNNKFDKDSINKIINSQEFSLFSGIAVGGLISAAIKEYLEKDN